MEFGINNDKITKSLLRTTIRRALRDIRRDPKRSVRNLVDLGLNFAEGCNQREIFDITQHYLSDENSAYYRLAENIVSDIDDEKLCTYGINFGYNGCTSGARILREKERELGCHIPFLLAFQVDSSPDSLTVADISETVEQGMKLGIFIYAVICSSDVYPQLLEMADEFSDCAFIYFVNPSRLTREIVSRTSELDNLVTSVRMDETDSCLETIKELRRQGCITAVHYEYDENDVNAILSNVYTDRMAETGTIAGILYAKAGIDKAVQDIVTSYVDELVRSQQYALFMFEAKSGISRIENIFSNRECLVMFSSGGKAFCTTHRQPIKGVSLGTNTLEEILLATNE